MFPGAPVNLQQTTSFKVVLPFYVYAAFSFFIAAILLISNTNIFNQHYFHPHTLALTHLMALGWGTMIILGASHQLLPVIIEGKLDSIPLAYLSFAFSGIGIPFLIIGFYIFHTGWVLQTGAVLVNIGVLCYLLNVLSSIYESKKSIIHAWFIGFAALWLFSTTFLGLLLVFNLTHKLLPSDSLEYLTLHAHFGIIGWFLMLVIGVGSRLIPMFLISKYTNNKILWWIFSLLNIGLILFILIKIYALPFTFYYLPVFLILTGVGMFGWYCRKAYTVRIRKGVDEQMKISLISVGQMLLPIFVLVVVLLLVPSQPSLNLIMLYGFCVFFGWLTAIILGMTFKTLPFIVWNKVYHKKAYAGKTPAPKELFNEKIFTAMMHSYLTGFVLFIMGVIFLHSYLLQAGAVLILVSSALYLTNIVIILLHKPSKQ